MVGRSGALEDGLVPAVGVAADMEPWALDEGSKAEEAMSSNREVAASSLRIKCVSALESLGAVVTGLVLKRFLSDMVVLDSRWVTRMNEG